MPGGRSAPAAEVLAFPADRRVRPMGAPCRASAPPAGGWGRAHRPAVSSRAAAAPRRARRGFVRGTSPACPPLPDPAGPRRFLEVRECSTSRAVSNQPIPRIEVEDYIEMGRLVAEWATDPDSRPADLAALKEQLAGVAVLPERVRTVEFVQGTLDHLVIRLPAKELDRGHPRAHVRPRGQPELPGSAVLRRPLPPGLRAGDDPARHAARAGRRPDHCPVPLTDGGDTGLRRKPCVRFASSLTTLGGWPDQPPLFLSPQQALEHAGDPGQHRAALPGGARWPR